MTGLFTAGKKIPKTAGKQHPPLQIQKEQPADLSARLQPQGQEAQVDLLGNHQVPSAQRQTIAATIGRTQGNRYLQQVIGRVVQRDQDPSDTSGYYFSQPTTYGPGQIPPELQKSIDPTLFSTDELLHRLDLIQQTLLQLDPSSPEAQHLQEQMGFIENTLNEREVEAQITKELEEFLKQFSNIKVTVRWKEGTGDQQVEKSEEVTFHPPYFMNVLKESRKKLHERTLERYDTAVANRRAADRATKKLLKEISRREGRGGMGISRAKVGKAYPEDLRKIVQTALDRNLIQAGKGRDHPNGEDLRAWLMRYGIGVDCSGFVSQALNQVTSKVRGTPLTKKERLNKGGAALKGGARGFTKIKDLTQLMAGDTMAIPGHIRIILSAHRISGGVQFVTGESRAGGKADVGPDRVEWRYLNGKLQKKRASDGKWVKSGEKPIFGRYKRLQSAREGAVAAANRSTP
jgi:hypothetical protein